MKFNLILIAFLICSSCVNTKNEGTHEKIAQIVDEYRNATHYNFMPYFSANLSTIFINYKKMLTLKCGFGKLEVNTRYDQFNKQEINNAKRTFEFCKKNEVYSILKYDNYSILTTNLWDSTYSQLLKLNPKYKIPRADFFDVKQPKSAHFKYSIIILNKGSELKDLNKFEDCELIYFQPGVYLYRSFVYWDVDEFCLFNNDW